MQVGVRVASCDDELLEAARVDLGAFGLPFARGPAAREALDRSLRWRRRTTTYLAELGGVPIGTSRTYAMDLSTPGGMAVPVAGIGDVGVLPGHTGQGVLRALVSRMLGDASHAAKVAAVLYASESTIYGRFGFGPATRARRVRIPVRRAALRADAAVSGGRATLVEPGEWAEVLPEVYRRASQRRGGEVSRTAELWEKVLRSPPAGEAMAGGVAAEPGVDGRFAMTHRGPDGAPLAYALYSVSESWQPEGPAHRMLIDELVALDAPSELAMWKALLGVGLVQEVEAWVPVDSPLLAALEDRWAPTVTGEHDKLWVRLLDPVAALGSRRYRCSGELVLRIHDEAAGITATTVALSVGPDGSGEAVTTVAGARDAEITLGVAELGEVWLGGGSLQSLASVGRVAEHAPGACARADALFGWSPLPWVTHDF